MHTHTTPQAPLSLAKGESWEEGGDHLCRGGTLTLFSSCFPEKGTLLLTRLAWSRGSGTHPMGELIKRTGHMWLSPLCPSGASPSVGPRCSGLSLWWGGLSSCAKGKSASKPICLPNKSCSPIINLTFHFHLSGVYFSMGFDLNRKARSTICLFTLKIQQPPC